MNILVIRLKSIGDVVLTLPAVNSLRDHYPAARITYLVSQEHAALLEGFTAINEVIKLDRKAFRSRNPAKILGHFFGLLRRLRGGRFDLVVDFQGFGETAWLTRLTGAPQRWGNVYGRGRAWAYTLGIPRDNRLHHAERFLAILRQAGLPSTALRNTFELPLEARKTAAAFLKNHQFKNAQPILFIQPLTSTPSRDWPLEKFIKLATHWQERGWQIVIGGGPGDRSRLEKALGGRFILAAGVPMLITGALMQASALVVGGDTGALHLAIALNRRVLMIMAAEAVPSAHPFQHPDWVVTPDGAENVQSLSLATVLAACERVLGSPSTTASPPG